MRLADFILSHMEAILAEWEAFARTVFPGPTPPTQLALRDHARQILQAIAQDLCSPQTRKEQSDKSQGLAQKAIGAPETAAETHAILRAKSGFDINQMVAEYRALRATVLRLWMDAHQFDDMAMRDVIRFNEAMDQAIAESIAFFSVQVDQARNLLLGMLGHDMRTPLHTIQLTASYLVALNAGDKVSQAASRLIRSGASMKALLDDLVDFSRTQLGLGINIRRTSADLAVLFSDELEQLRGAHPARQLQLAVSGDMRGCWDGLRLQQLLRNLVSNAIKYGDPDAPVLIMLSGEETDVLLEVENSGPTLDGSVVEQLFKPLKRGPAQENSVGTDEGLGLGLFIVREVAVAHGGDVALRSERGQTVFSVRLPRTDPGGATRSP